MTTGEIIAYAITAVTAAGSLIFNWRKGDIDESTVVLDKWKQLVEAHEASIKRLTDDFTRERTHWQSENDRLQKRIETLETQNTEKDDRIKALENEINGLNRSIIQNSKSTAFFLGKDTGDKA